MVKILKAIQREMVKYKLSIFAFKIMTKIRKFPYIGAPE